MSTNKKKLDYWRANAEDGYVKTPLSVLKYISELECKLYTEEEVKELLLNYASDIQFQNINLNV